MRKIGREVGLIVALAACFGALVVGIRVVDWWRGTGP